VETKRRSTTNPPSPTKRSNRIKSLDNFSPWNSLLATKITNVKDNKPNISKNSGPNCFIVSMIICGEGGIRTSSVALLPYIYILV
jgi:hypothetical protein